MAKGTDFDGAFSRLKEILEPYAPELALTADTGDNYSLDTRTIMENKKPLFFGSVRRGKSAVSFHLMPVYTNPALLDTISPELKKRMQGKSCFNFKSVDENLFAELKELTKAGFEEYREKGMS